MADNLVDAFFTVTNAGPGAEQTGFGTLDDRVARYGWVGGQVLDPVGGSLERRWPDLPAATRPDHPRHRVPPHLDVRDLDLRRNTRVIGPDQRLIPPRPGHHLTLCAPPTAS